MKKLILSLVVVFGFTTVSQAQSEGKIWLGNSIGFQTSKVKDGERVSNYNILPEVGYGFSDNLAVGLRFGYAHREEWQGPTKLKMDGFTVNPFVRYAFWKGEVGGLFVDGGVGYTYGKSKPGSIKSHALEIGFRPGVYFNLTDRVSITGKFGFVGYDYEKIDDTKINTITADFDLSNVQVGISIIL